LPTDRVTTHVLFHQIPVMKASIALVIVDAEGEKNVSASWTGDYPQVLLTEQLDINDTTDKCNNFGRIASTGESFPNSSIV